jgi:hypothetical protein
VEERDHEPFDVQRGQAMRGGTRGRLVERRVDAAVGAQPLPHLGHPRSRDQRQGPDAVEVERVGQSQSLQLEDVAEPSVTSSPRRAPVRWISVFTAMVVPCTTVPISPGRSVLARELGQPRAHRRGELVRGRGHLEAGERAGPRVEDAKSVNVPPMSMPSQ